MRSLVILVSLPSLALAGGTLVNGSWNDEIYLMDGTDRAAAEDCPNAGESGCYRVLHNRVINEFYGQNQDAMVWDTIVSQSSFAFASTTAFAFYSSFCNDVQGIGRTLDAANCPLPTGYSFMNNAELFVSGNITWMHDVMGQEMEHQFGAFVTFEKDLTCSTDLLGRDGSHWSFWMDTDGSVMEGNKWQDQADGTFITLTPEGGFTDLDLYLWGFIPPDQVRPFFYLEDPFPLAFDVLPEAGTGPTARVVALGRPYWVDIYDVIACEGERFPTAETAPKVTREALILVSEPDAEPEQEAFDGIRRFRREWNTYFYRTTDFTGRAITTRDGVDDMPWWEFGHQEEVDKLETSAVGELTWVSDTEKRQERRVAFDVAGPSSAITLSAIRVRPSWQHFNFETEKVQDDPLYNAIVVRMQVDAGSQARIEASCGGETFELSTLPLIPDGELYTYSAPMPADWDCDLERVSLYPSDQAAHVEVDRIEFVLAQNDQEDPDNSDRDQDGFVDALENCPGVPNPDQADGNHDGFGDACEDADLDGMPNGLDNCPLHFNAPGLDRSRPGCENAAEALLDPLCLVQDDSDGDGIGDACDSDEGCACAIGSRPAAPPALLLLASLAYVWRRRGSRASRRLSPTRL